MKEVFKAYWKELNSTGETATALLSSIGLFGLLIIVFAISAIAGEAKWSDVYILITMLFVFQLASFILIYYKPISKIKKYITEINFRDNMKKNTNRMENYLGRSNTLRTSLLIDLIGRSVLYCWFFVFVFGGITLKFISYHSMEYLKNHITVEELLNKNKSLIDFMFWIKIHTDYILYDYRWPAVIITSFLFMWFYTSKAKIKFICPHCLKYVLFKNISRVHCSLCETPNHSRFELITYCGSCREKMEYVECPHCCRTIEMSHGYNETSLMNKRKENAKLKPILLTGLRELYNRKKRLPQFICKHCLKTLITKNYNLTCPHCKAEYLVTDNRNQAQVGDVKIKNYRHIVDESTMEKVLFHSCIQCGGIIEAVRCYHEDCKKEINLREKYDEVELLRRRYEQENS